MKRSRFTDSQIIAVLKQAEAGTPVPAECAVAEGILGEALRTWLQLISQIHC